MIDLHTPKLDIATQIQLIILKLGELEKRLDDMKISSSNISARLKGLEDLKLPQELQILQIDIKELKKKVLRLEEVSERKADLINKLRKINK